jgi:hypothetical protein
VNLAEQLTDLSSMDQLCRLEVPSTLISAVAAPSGEWLTLFNDLGEKAHNNKAAPTSAKQANV